MQNRRGMVDEDGRRISNKNTRPNPYRIPPNHTKPHRITPYQSWSGKVINTTKWGDEVTAKWPKHIGAHQAHRRTLEEHRSIPKSQWTRSLIGSPSRGAVTRTPTKLKSDRVSLKRSSHEGTKSTRNGANSRRKEAKWFREERRRPSIFMDKAGGSWT